MKTVAFHNLGCKVNSYEMEVMQQKFKESGYSIVPFDDIADIYVINTCTVTAIADHKSRQMLHRAKKRNPEAVVVAAGCYAQTDTEGAALDPSVDVVIGNNRKSEIVKLVEDYIDDRSKRVTVDDLSIPAAYEESGIDYSCERTRVDIKIQDGCDQFCTYCIIPTARGRVRSRGADSVVKEIKRLSEAGFKEVVLTGIHLSSYGLDMHRDDCGRPLSYNRAASDKDYTNEDLIGIIDAVSHIDGIERIRLGSLEPRVITEEFLAAISADPKVCPHFHLSLQSGCDATLKRMNRRYTTGEYYDKVKLIREYFNAPAITTDIIVGFPGEDEEEFNTTVDYVQKIGFYETHVFKYSKRKGTLAADMPDQNTEKIKAQRSDILLRICDENRLKFIEAHIGRECEILIEEEKIVDGRPMLVGHTRDYIPAAIPSYKDGDKTSVDTLQRGDIIRAVVGRIYDGYLILEA